MSDRPILILGKNGQVGRHLVRVFPQALAWGRQELDLTDSASIQGKIQALNPSWIINAAAYTAVDQAESEPELAMQINGVAVGEIALAVRACDAGLIHFSTDYVFDGSKDGPYLPEDSVCPINAYGRSKLAGEEAIQAVGGRYWLLRTSWVFSEYPPNFVATMLRLAQERDEIRVVDDQVGVPTYAGELAGVALRLVEGVIQVAPGVHHACGADPVAWFGFAQAVMDTAKRQRADFVSPELSAISTKDYPTPAARPKNSVLGGGAGLGMCSWREGIEDSVAALMAGHASID